jgi:hypothetical protein
MRIDWIAQKKQIKKLMKIMTDEQLAAKYGITTSRFREKRKILKLTRPDDTPRTTYRTPTAIKGKCLNWDFSAQNLNIN